MNLTPSCYICAPRFRRKPRPCHSHFLLHSCCDQSCFYRKALHNFLPHSADNKGTYCSRANVESKNFVQCAKFCIAAQGSLAINVRRTSYSSTSRKISSLSGTMIGLPRSCQRPSTNLGSVLYTTAGSESRYLLARVAKPL